MNAKVLTVEEAHALLPRVKEIVDRLRRLRHQIAATQERIAVLEALWDDEIRNESNPDAEEYRKHKLTNRRQVRQFRKNAEELDRLGCHVKDLDSGIVGVFHVRDGKAVFMSWNLDDTAHETYEELENNPRVYSVEEARAMLPRLREIFREFDRVSESLEKARHELSLLEVMWGDDVEDDDHPDAPQVRRLTQEIRRLVRYGRDLERELHLAGCVLTDFQRGLIDFYHVRDGQIVYLCWQRDEPDIIAWHPLDAGYATRRSLDNTDKGELGNPHAQD